MNTITRLSGCLCSLVTLLLLPSANQVHAANVLELNIFYPGSGYEVSTLQHFQQNLGISFTASKWYQDWSQPFDVGVAQRFHEAGYVPELTWQPQVSGSGISFKEVTAGHFDDYLTSTAQTIKNLQFPVRISLAPEMNENWVSWGIGNLGNDAQGEKNFWQYTVQKFRDAGATNVEWIWSPNIQNGNEKATYVELFPGDAYVNYLGLDGYNWGTTRSWSAWQSFKDVFAPSYRAIGEVSGKNIQIMETASTEAGGDKAEWIRQMFVSLRSEFPRVQGLTWFDINKETDWRIDSTIAARTAFSEGARGIVPVLKPVPVTVPVATGTPEPIKTVHAQSVAIKKTPPIISSQPVSVTATVVNPAVPTYPVVTPKIQQRTLAAPVRLGEREVAGALNMAQDASSSQPTQWWIVLVLALIAFRLNQPKRRVLQSVPGLYQLGNRS